MYCYIQRPKPCSRPPLTHASAGDSWTLTGKSGSVFCGITAPFSWVLVHARFCLCHPRDYFPDLCKFWQLYGGVNDNLLHEGLCHTQVCCTQSPCPCSSPLLTRTSTGGSNTAQIQFCFNLCGGMGQQWTATGTGALGAGNIGMALALLDRSPLTSPQSWQNLHRPGKLTLGGHTQYLACTRTQEKGAVTPQETDPDLPRSVQESKAEAWVEVTCCRVGARECSSACMGSFEGHPRYLHYLHHSLAPDK